MSSQSFLSVPVQRKIYSKWRTEYRKYRACESFRLAPFEPGCGGEEDVGDLLFSGRDDGKIYVIQHVSEIEAAHYRFQIAVVLEFQGGAIILEKAG